ncbi:serine/threonine-protein kinase HipA [Homoserinimonas aerilata]|uniref:Serine/threonine-protein kinase HipA n=2 Tax=Homoserinimonas aerilata TaxID=1162970 RepID=A0A542YGH1_9MICO|nr:serine/threonine-protein kinase HipA [Homoserinimonas aerilata]
MVFTHVNVIEVRAFGHTVGAVSASRAGAYAFEFDPQWVRRGIQLAPILMPATSRSRPFIFPGLPEATFHRLPPMIADSLPDKFGNAITDSWLATQGVAAGDVTALDRLTYLGSRGLGALEYLPARGPVDAPASALDMAQLVTAARDVVHGTLKDDATSERALRQIISVGTSAGGARAKAVVNFNPVTSAITAGHIMPEHGFEAWLLKFDGMGLDRQLGHTQAYGRVEYAYSLMAAAAGIQTPETRLLEENGRAHFMTRRFDRPGDGAKLHAQTLTGIAGIDFNAVGVNDYAQLFTTIAALGLGAEARAQAFRRMVFNYAAANCDDHAKNHSFLMDAAGQWSLAPAYDITHAYNPEGEWTHQHLMGIGGVFMNPTRSHLLEFAERHDVLHSKALIEDVNDAVDNWSEFADRASLEVGHADSIAKDHRRL